MKHYKLYYINGCPGARAVRLFLRYKKLKFEEVLIDFSKGEHKTDEFLKYNPMHTVPTLLVFNNNDIVQTLYESRVILKYLDGLYGQPIVPVLELDKWLFWDLGFLSPNIGKIIYPRLFRNQVPNESDIPAFLEKIKYLENHLNDNKFLVSDTLTIADLSASMLIFNSQYEKSIFNVENNQVINDWLQRIESKFSVDDWNEVMTPFLTHLFSNQV
jgi:glutathione S-transferase